LHVETRSRPPGIATSRQLRRALRRLPLKVSLALMLPLLEPSRLPAS